MANYKGVGVLFIKKYLKNLGPEAEKIFLSQIPKEDRDLYLNCLAFTWVPIEKATKFYEVAAKMLFPNETRGMARIGKELAKDNLGGIYSILIRFATIPYVVKQAAQFWKTYHQSGQASAIAEEHKKQLYFVVEQYPSLPEHFRELLRGYIEGVIEMTGGRMVSVQKAELNKDGWRWFASWA